MKHVDGCVFIFYAKNSQQDENRKKISVKIVT